MAKNKNPEETKEQEVMEEVADTTVEEAKAIDPKAKAKIEKVEQTAALPTEVEIKKMKRDELNRLAVKLGLNPDEFRNADALRSGIFAALEEAKKTTPKNSKTKAKEKTTASEEIKAKKTIKANPPRPRIERRGKRYKEAAALIDKSKSYPLEEAVNLALKTSTVKFDSTVEIHLNLGVDPKQSDQLIRGTLVLPHGSGTTKRVAVVAPESEHVAAKKAGADKVGLEDLLEEIKKENIDFDILVAHPDVMVQLSKLAKVLGPKGLMPSPKSGTVTANLEKTVKELKSGRVEYRVDRYGIVHQAVGKVSFKPQALVENIKSLVSAINQAKPPTLKGIYLQNASLTTSMGPGIKLDISNLN